MEVSNVSSLRFLTTRESFLRRILRALSMVLQLTEFNSNAFTKTIGSTLATHHFTERAGGPSTSLRELLKTCF